MGSGIGERTATDSVELYIKGCYFLGFQALLRFQIENVYMGSVDDLIKRSNKMMSCTRRNGINLSCLVSS
jgi:hypothetical protein